MDKLSPAERGQLAALHCASLPDSQVSELGVAYAREFYHYLSRSPFEQIFVARAGDEIIGGCVLSLSPRTLRRRLLLHTPLLFHAVGWLWRRVSRRGPPALSRRSHPPEGEATVPRHLPELILVYTRAELRSRGTGTGLVTQCEQFLAERGHQEYIVRTVDDENNRALRFYDKNGFLAFSRSADHGRIFRVFRKKVSTRN
jgi:ribosomal protein S18 acetylase RimI-like enzyme